jgi:hypothetical protein
LVLRLYQETVHDFILLFMPPCGPHLTPLATGSLERSLLVFSTSGGLTGNELSRLFFTCTNMSQADTCTCNTYPRICPHNVVNHSSHKEATIHRSSNHTWSSTTKPCATIWRNSDAAELLRWCTNASMGEWCSHTPTNHCGTQRSLCGAICTHSSTTTKCGLSLEDTL